MQVTKLDSKLMDSLLERLKQSGKSLSQFCKDENVATQQLYYWQKKRSRKEKPKPEFIKIATAQVRHYENPICEIHFPSGIRVTFKTQPNASFIKQLV